MSRTIASLARTLRSEEKRPVAFGRAVDVLSPSGLDRLEASTLKPLAQLRGVNALSVVVVVVRRVSPVML